jgi:hypothetical protein
VVAVPDGCRSGSGLADDGYGRWTTDDDHTVAPHRWLWEQLHGPVPPDCICCTPAPRPAASDDNHLRVGTQAENQAQMGRRNRGAGPWKVGVADTRGPGNRARAIRAVLIGGYDAERLAEAMSASNVNRDQLRLDFDDSPSSSPPGPAWSLAERVKVRELTCDEELRRILTLSASARHPERLPVVRRPST